MKKNIGLALLCYTTTSLSTLSSESLEKIVKEQGTTKFQQFITKVKEQTTDANKVTTNYSFFTDFFNTLATVATGEKVNLEDAKKVKRFFDNTQYTLNALTYFQDPTQYATDLVTIFTEFQKTSRTLENLKACLNNHNLNYLITCNIIDAKGVSIDQLYDKKNDTNNYIIPDNIYAKIITDGLIATFIYANNLDR